MKSQDLAKPTESSEVGMNFQSCSKWWAGKSFMPPVGQLLDVGCPGQSQDLSEQ